MELHELVERPTVIEVNLGHLRHNVHCIRGQVGQGRKIMAIIKANAYGHGLIPVAKCIEAVGIDFLGVAFVEEGIALRRAGVTTPILVLGGIYKAQIASYLDFGLSVTVSSVEKLRQVEEVALARKTRAVIHLKIDTGMERVGVHSESAGSLIEAALRSRATILEGIYSHLACADDQETPMTREQLARFLEVTANFDRLDAPMPLRHLANSGGIMYFPDTHLDMVRPGIMLYGVLPDLSCPQVLDLRPLLTLKSAIVYFKVVQPHRPISYGATWQTDHQIRVVTIPIGYGDGYRRSLSSQGAVLIRGRRYPIVGRVCMDQFMVNIEWDSAYNGDEVVLIGSQGEAAISVEEVARLAGTIPYEILTGLNDRIPRRYIE